MKSRIASCLFVVLAILSPSLALAKGAAEANLPLVDSIAILSSVSSPAGELRCVAREFEKGAKAVPADVNMKDVAALINLDVFLQAGPGEKIPFDVKKLNGQTIDEPKVIVIIPFAFIKNRTGKDPAKMETLYILDGKAWVDIRKLVGKGAEMEAFGKGSAYFWIQINTWPVDDRFVGC
jgi:hypothetical protein